MTGRSRRDEEAWIASLLQSHARDAIAAARPPDPADIWRRAEVARRIARREELSRRAGRPVLVFQRLALPLGVAATAVWVALTRDEAARLTAFSATADPVTLALAGVSVLTLMCVVASELIHRLTRY